MLPLRYCSLLKVKIEVYSLISSEGAALLTLSNYFLVTGPLSFISHLNLPRSIQPGSHKFCHTWLITHTSLHSPIRYPLLLLLERVYLWVKALPKSTASTANSAQPVIEPMHSHLQIAHATTEPWRPTGNLNTRGLKMIYLLLYLLNLLTVNLDGKCMKFIKLKA